MDTLLVTGCAGFIGFHLCRELLVRGLKVVGVDNLNSYYDIDLKKSRLQILKREGNFSYYQLNIQDCQSLNEIFSSYKISHVVNLAAQAGVRYSMQQPQMYIDSNISGFLNILESCRDSKIQHLIYASSSSVYGLNPKVPFSTNDRVEHPISLYAATKKANELMAHSYSYMYKIPTTGLRLFTVYGPWGRPDMAYFLFADKIVKGQPIQVFNQGKMKRDFTYIDDIIECIYRLIDSPPKATRNWEGEPSNSFAPYKIYNIGNSKPVELLYFIEILEKSLDKKAIKDMLPMQLGDMIETFADNDDFTADFDFKPSTSIEKGIERFAKWFKWYYG